MHASPVERRLAAILAADLVGYSRLVAEDEDATLRQLGAYRATMADLIAEHGGRIFGSAGDSLIAEFTSAVQAVRAAVAIQRALNRRNADVEPTRRMDFRIGVNLGDVRVQGDDLLGDGVNIAARLQEVAAPAGICISGAVREQTDGRLGFPIASLGERTLKNIPRAIDVYGVHWRLDDAGDAPGGAPALPDKPSVAVLPFGNMSGDPEQEYFCDGITEDLITALARYRWLFVIARNSTFAYKGRAVDIKQVARELGVRYVLEGSVRKAGSRVRVTAQLIEAETGAHLWAERFDRDDADFFAIQDEISESVVAAIEPEILLGEGRRAARKSTAALDAFDCCMRGLWHHYQFAPDENLEAETWLRRAIEREPKLARAHWTLARVLCSRCLYGWSPTIDADLADALGEARVAVALDDSDPYAHYISSMVHHCRGQQESALAEAQRAIDLSPNLALGFFALGASRVFVGHFEAALEALKRCLRLNPRDPQSYLFINFIARAHYHLGAYEQALHDAERTLSGRRMHAALYRQALNLGQLGRKEKAAAAAAEMAAAPPADPLRHWTLANPYVDRAHLEHLVDGLRKAGASWPGGPT